MAEKCVLFGPHRNISAYTQSYELKISTQTNCDTLISTLKLNFNVISLWRRNDVIFEKSAKIISFVNSYLYIYWFSIINNFSFGRYYKYSILFLIWVKKAKDLKYCSKIWPFLSEKPVLCWWHHQNKRNICCLNLAF